MLFELFCPVYNEQYMLPFMVEHYHNCITKNGHRLIINIYDNCSTDDTIKIAKSLGCNTGVYSLEQEIRDDYLVNFKNNIWKTSTADFAIVIDCDEFIEINPNKLKGITIIKCEGYDMLGYGENTPNTIVNGIRHEPEDKTCIFSPFEIQEINYTVGAHNANPIGNLIWNKTSVRLLHMKAHSLEYMINKFNESKHRLSAINKKNNWGNHYNMTEDEIANFHAFRYGNKIKLR